MPDPDSDAFIGLDPADLPMADVQRLLLHCVAPRPIALTATVGKDGRQNLAPFSYFMVGGANPPSVVISPITGKDGAPKHTLCNIEDTGEYVINVVTYDLREQMNRASIDYPHGVSEWDMAGLTPVPSVRVSPPRAAESPLAMECRLFKVVPHGAGHMAANYVIGEVVFFHVARRLMPAGVFEPRHIDYVARLGGDAYLRSIPEAVFTLPRPGKP